MPKRTDIKKVLVIGSGPIVIGQAAEFDYAGTQACRALKEEGLEVILVNSNPATIMTDKHIADRVYIEPLTADVLKSICYKEMPDSILPTLGGQTALNLAMELSEQGFFKSNGIRLLGTNVSAIKTAEDRLEFKEAMSKIGQPSAKSIIATNVEDGLAFAREIGFPIVIRPAYTLGGSGGGIAHSEEEFIEIAQNGLRLSRVHQILVEQSIAGYREIEFEVMRDSSGRAISICDMENIDPVGIHTGDSFVVAPCQTLSKKELLMLRRAALDIINHLEIEGGCNVQFALKQDSLEYAVIEVNPRLSRSSALASKATGYPIARIATKIALGYHLKELENAAFDPVVNYVVVKAPKWPFDKFAKAKRTLSTQMKATGEVMAISDNLLGALNKAVRSAELGVEYLDLPTLKFITTEELIDRLEPADDERMFVVAELLRRGISSQEIIERTAIVPHFIEEIGRLVDFENSLRIGGVSALEGETLLRAKKWGLTNRVIARLARTSEREVADLLKQHNIAVQYKPVKIYGIEKSKTTPYLYSTFTNENVRQPRSKRRKKALVLGSGPIRIGQGIEFDYASVHCVWALKAQGYETIIINSNPETVSTDYDTADKLYFEPLSREDLLYLIQTEKPDAAIVQFGGQTAINLAKTLVEAGVPIMGTSLDAIDECEDRDRFDAVLERCNILRPKASSVFNLTEAKEAANKLGYPVLVRPSYVLGGKGMQICYNDGDVEEFVGIIAATNEENHPILIDKYLMGKELEVDAICDKSGEILIPGIMEHIERAGIHSGDSISVYPPQTIPPLIKQRVVEYTRLLARAIKVVGLINIQFVYFEDALYVIEVNPRSSRTVPYISKVTNIPVVDIATACAAGKLLKDLKYGNGLFPEGIYTAVKVPVFSFEKLSGVEINLGPEMKSTGEALGIDRGFAASLYKGLVAANLRPPLRKDNTGVLLTVNNEDKSELVPLARAFNSLGFKLYATKGTANILIDNDIPVIPVNKIGEGAKSILDVVSSGKISALVNTPQRARRDESDGLKIRRRCVELGIPCFTCLDTAWAMIEALKLNTKDSEINTVDITRI